MSQPLSAYSLGGKVSRAFPVQGFWGRVGKMKALTRGLGCSWKEESKDIYPDEATQLRNNFFFFLI